MPHEKSAEQSQMSERDRRSVEHVLSDPVLIAAVLRGTLSTPEYRRSGRVPLEVFKVLAERTLPTLEVIPVRRDLETGKTQVLLYERSWADPWWPGMTHAPGVVILDQEMGRVVPFERILGEKGELEGGVRVADGASPVHVHDERRTKEKTGRGPEIASVYYVVVEGDDPTVGQFYDVDAVASGDFPPDHPLIPHHRQMILDAAERFEQDTKRAALAGSVGQLGVRS